MPRKPRDNRRAIPAPRPKPETTLGTVYLLHFAAPPRFKNHYVGWTSNLPQRVRAHANGDGCYTTAAFADAGIPFAIARLWPDQPTRFERQIKKRGPANYCPLCAERRRKQTGWSRGQAELRAVGLLPESEWLR
ncbi:MAG: hypothetical protein DLM62_05515 [Pseudonocardiales bacterium]|nr:MAG: hypothetical protein DLM62_05515 [Pseudonocardiales bacterium]